MLRIEIELKDGRLVIETKEAGSIISLQARGISTASPNLVSPLELRDIAAACTAVAEFVERRGIEIDTKTGRRTR